MQKLPKPILLYLLSLEMLPILDDLNASSSIKKAVRTIESFAYNSSVTIEQNEDLSKFINDDIVQAFSKMIDSISIDE